MSTYSTTATFKNQGVSAVAKEGQSTKRMFMNTSSPADNTNIVAIWGKYNYNYSMNKTPKRANGAAAMRLRFEQDPELAERVRKSRSEGMKKYWERVKEALNIVSDEHH